jgi:hypothetical protein
MGAAADGKGQKMERLGSQVCSRVLQTCWQEMAYRRWWSKVKLYMEKPVREEMSVSVVMSFVDSGADADPCCSNADRDSTVQRTWMIATLRTETDSHQSPRLVPWVA